MGNRFGTLIATGAVLALLGCAAPATPPTATPTSAAAAPSSAPTSPPPTSPAPASASSASSAAPTPGPAWQSVLDSVGADGTVSLDTALQAFSLAIGPLPGVSVPAGDAGFVHSGTMAVRWLTSYWSELTVEQRDAAIALLPELASFQASRPLITLAVQNRANDAYTKLAQDLFGEIGSHLQSPLNAGLTIKVRVGPTQKATSGAETGVYSAQYNLVGPPATCLIVVSPAGDAQSDVDVRAMMAHEVWHCYEGAIVGLARYWSQNPAPWITEGQAEWVAATLEPDAPSMAGSWDPYLDTPSKPLFERAYSALGFYAQLDQAGLDPWSSLIDILQATDNASAFSAGGGDQEDFLNRWASGLLRDGSRGDPWAIDGPAITSDTAVPGGIHLNNGGAVGEQVAPYANEISVFQETPDVLNAAISGHARLSDTSGHDYVLAGTQDFCMLDTGCDCPDSTDEPPPPLDGDAVALAVSGGTEGATGTLGGTSLDDFCRGGLSGTWEGTWTNDPSFGDPPTTGGFTMTLAQTGKSFSGTVDVSGPTCVRHGTVNGSVSGANVQFGWITDVATPVKFEGSYGARQMSGTWTAIACEPVGMPIFGSWQATKLSGPAGTP